MKKTDEEILAIIESKISTGINADAGEISQTRKNLFDRYMGAPLGDETDGSSKVVTREVLESIEWVMPSLMRIFAGDDIFVLFEPEGLGDEDAAKQETEYINHVFQKENAGFLVLYDFIKDTLMNPNGYVKVSYNTEEEIETERYKGLMPQEVAQLMDDDTVEIVGQEENTDGTNIWFDLEVKRTIPRGGVEVDSVPPEDIIISNSWKKLSLDDCDFVCHKTLKTKSDLVEMGYPKKEVDQYFSGVSDNESDEANVRAVFTDEQDYTTDENDESMEECEFREVYIKLDLDDDGIAERYLISCIEGHIFAQEPLDYMPIVAMSAIRTPHRHVGVAWAELVVELQSIKTTLIRQLLNNVYRVNNPRPVVNPNLCSLSDVLNDLPNAPIRSTDIVNGIRMEPTQPIIQHAIPALDYIDKIKHVRTGVTEQTMGADAETLARSTKGAFMGALEQANQRIELLARFFAETGIKEIFLKIHELLMKNQTETLQFKPSGGQWVAINPSEWKRRRSMRVSVGVGYGTKEQKLAGLNLISKMQAQIVQLGNHGVVSPSNVYNMGAKMAELTNVGEGDKFFTNPPPPQPGQKKPDPTVEMLKLQAMADKMKAENDKVKMSLQHQNEISKLQAQILDMQQDGQLKVRDLTRKEEETALDFAHKAAKLEQKADTEEQDRQTQEAIAFGKE